MFALSAGAFLLYACDMPESSSSASPGVPPPYKLTQDKGGTNFTLKIDEGVTTIKAGEFAAVPSIGSGADKRTLNTKITRQALGVKTDGEVHTAVTTIILPSTLTTIEDYAFYGHTEVKGTLIIPDKVHTIGAHAFGKTGTALTLDLKDDSKLGTIGAGAFDIASIAKIQAPRFTLTKNTDNTTYTVAVAEGVTTVARGEFSLQESTGGSPPITLNTRLKGALLGAKPQDTITTITLPSTLTTIEDYAFYGHTAVKLVRIPKAVQSLGASAFGQTGTALTLDFEDDSQLDIFGSAAFDIARIKTIQAPRFTLAKNADNTTYTLAVAEGVTTVAEGEFSALDTHTIGGTSITFNTRLKGPFLLDGSNRRAQVSITAITLPSTLAAIEDYAFYNHTYVQGTLAVPKQVRSIGKYAFYYLGTGSDIKDRVNVVFESESQLATLKAYAFRQAFLRRITLPNQLEIIEPQAFGFVIGLQNASSFTIPENVRSIGKSAFIKMDHNITGTLTIKSQALAKTAANTPLENHLFIVPGIETVSNFDTIELYKQVYCSYTETERNSIFGTGAAYTSLDGAETYTAASCSD